MNWPISRTDNYYTGWWDSLPVQFLDCETSQGNFKWRNDRIQDMLHQNMATQHIDCFKLEECENWQVQERLSYLPLKQVLRPPCERCCPCIWRKEASLSPKMEDYQEEFELMFLAKFLPTYSFLFTLLFISYDLLHTGLHISLVFISFWMVCVTKKLLLSKFVCSYLINLVFIIEMHLRT